MACYTTSKQSNITALDCYHFDKISNLGPWIKSISFLDVTDLAKLKLFPNLTPKMTSLVAILPNSDIGSNIITGELALNGF